MNYTTTDYLEQLEQDRQDLVDNLETQGITGLTGDETFTELVPEVLNISGGADLSEYFTSDITIGTAYPALKLIKKTPPLTISGTSLNQAFQGCINLVEVGMIDTSNITDMSYMFSGCRNLTTVPTFNTGNVTNFQNMFQSCHNLTTIPDFNTSSAQRINMFESCISLTSFNKTWDLRNVTIMGSMFNGCTALTTVDFSNCQFDSTKNINIGYLFSGCTNLTFIDLRTINLSNCTNHSNMFGSSSSHVPYDTLIIVDDTPNKTWMNTNFPNYTNVKTVAEYAAEQSE